MKRELELIDKQLEALSSKTFDLNAWKMQTTIFLERIFGKGDSKIRMINDLQYDFSSWNLRDTSGGGKTADPIRLQAKTVLEAARTELEFLGAPQNKGSIKPKIGQVLSPKKTTVLESILEKEQNDEELLVYLSSLKKEKLVQLLALLLK